MHFPPAEAVLQEATEQLCRDRSVHAVDVRIHDMYVT